MDFMKHFLFKISRFDDNKPEFYKRPKPIFFNKV